MNNLIAQHEDFSIYTFDHKCFTTSDIGGGITDCVQGDFIVKKKDIEVFRCYYIYELWCPEGTLNIYNKVGLYDIVDIKTMLNNIPKKHSIIGAIVAYKKNELGF
jgi:hypothetical protein